MDTDKTRSPPMLATYTVDEAATILGISRASAYRAARTGVIPALRIGSSLRIPCRALQRMLDIEAAA
jgi:excisionase family DNA binding protein